MPGLLVLAAAAAAIVADAPAAQVTVTEGEIVYRTYAYTDPRPLVGGDRCHLSWYVQFPQVQGATSAMAVLDHRSYGTGLEYPTIGDAPWDSSSFSAGGERHTEFAPPGTSWIPLDGFDTPGLTSCATSLAQSDGAWTLRSLTAEVENQAPVASLTWGSSSTDPLLVELDGSGSTDDAGIASYAWSFPDGSTATGATPTHAFPDFGTYRVSLMVTDAEGLEDTAAVDIDLEQEPGALEIVLQVRPAGGPTVFSFEGSGSIGSFQLDGDPATALSDRTSFAEIEPGRYTVTQDVPEDWRIGSLACTDPTLDSTTQPADALAEAAVDPGETVTCTFGLDQVGPVVVNSTRDLSDEIESDEACDTGATITRNGAEEPECTLRAAIEHANGASGPQIIRFAIEGAAEITLASALPTAIGPLTVDGTSQGPNDACPFSIPNCVELVSSASGPVVDVAGRGVTLGGFYIHSETSSAGIRTGPGGEHLIEGNLIELITGASDYNPSAIELVSSSDVRVEGNQLSTRGSAVRVVGGEGQVIEANRILNGTVSLVGTSGVLVGGEAGSPGDAPGNVLDTVFVAGSDAVTIKGNRIQQVEVESGSDVRIFGNAFGRGPGDVGGAGVVVRESAAEVLIGAASPTPGASPGNTFTDGAGIVLEGDRNRVAGNRLTGDPRVPCGTGITVSGEGNVIGGAAADTGNNVAGYAIGVLVADATGTDVVGNLVGIAGSNGTGIQVGSDDSGCGAGASAGGTLLEGNVVSGNANAGVWIIGSQGTELRGNRVGTNAAGTAAVPNGNGIIVDGPAVIGSPGAGACDGACNLVSGNERHGIWVQPDVSESDPIVITGNVIGADMTGAAPLSNGIWGVLFNGGGPGVHLGGTGPGEANTIAYNAAGVVVQSGVQGIGIRGNSIHSNRGVGIDLQGDGSAPNEGVTPNDLGDPDTGGNNLQNFPEWRTVDLIDGEFRITGRIPIHATVQGTYLVDAYLQESCDPSGYGEGTIHYATVSTTDFGEGFFELRLPPAVVQNRVLTATATGPDGSTSEFSQCLDASNAAAPTLTAAAPAGTTRLEVSSSQGLVGKVVELGAGPTTERNYGVATGSLVLARATRFAHAAGETVTPLDDTLFVSVERAVITRSARLPDVALLWGRLQAVAGSSIACGEDVTLTLDGGTVAQRVPGTRFVRPSGSRCVFVARTENGIGRLELDLQHGTWSAQVIRRDLERLTNPVEVGLRIGGDAGSEPLRFREAGPIWTYVR